jgi:hypothetical protein
MVVVARFVSISGNFFLVGLTGGASEGALESQMWGAIK